VGWEWTNRKDGWTKRAAVLESKLKRVYPGLFSKAKISTPSGLKSEEEFFAFFSLVYLCLFFPRRCWKFCFVFFFLFFCAFGAFWPFGHFSSSPFLPRTVYEIEIRPFPHMGLPNFPDFFSRKFVHHKLLSEIYEFVTMN